MRFQLARVDIVRDLLFRARVTLVTLDDFPRESTKLRSVSGFGAGVIMVAYSKQRVLRFSFS